MWEVNFNPKDELPAIALHFLPLNHIAGHISLLKAFARGGTSYFTRATDMSTFFEVGGRGARPVQAPPTLASLLRHSLGNFCNFQGRCKATVYSCL
jgi:hypothetical protein